MAIKTLLKKILVGTYNQMPVKVTWHRENENSLLSKVFAKNLHPVKSSPYSKQINKIAKETNELGAQPLWQGYKSFNIKGGSGRKPDEVRTNARMGEIFTQLVQSKKPRTIVEFGTAFGVSGMYFLAGLELNGDGKLLTFEPNNIWAEIARKNLERVSNRFTLTVGTFEENIDSLIDGKQVIDLAFIDAIHTKAFVKTQLEIVLARAAKDSIIIFDDIDFSEDMAECWREVAADERFVASLQLGNRVGIVEYR